MDFKNCTFYGLQSKQRLKELLLIKRNVYLKNSFINSKISIYKRLTRIIECPDDDIKSIQKNILTKLQPIGVPDYVFSGIKGKCFNDLNLAHSKFKYSYRLDIKKYFYNISRNRIYEFYNLKLNTSPDVANILTNLSAINLEKKNLQGLPEIKNLIENGKILPEHLIAGAPQSPLLSFFVNLKMFDAIFRLARTHGVLFSLYVDDLFFSSDNFIDEGFILQVKNIIRRFNYSLQESKQEQNKLNGGISYEIQAEKKNKTV